MLNGNEIKYGQKSDQQFNPRLPWGIFCSITTKWGSCPPPLDFPQEAIYDAYFDTIV